MRSFLVTLLSCVAAQSACAQGKVTFANDSNHYFVLGNVRPEDAAYGGGTSDTSSNTASGAPGAIPVSPLPSGITLAVALYAGTDSNNLSLQATHNLDSNGWKSPGRMNNYNVVLTGIPGGSTAYFEIYLYNGAYADPFISQMADGTFGTSGLFTAIPGNAATYPGLVSGGPSQSTWNPANLVVNEFIPEPATLALGAVGLAFFVIGRRFFPRSPECNARG